MAVPNEVTLALMEYVGLFLGLAGCILMKLDQRQPKAYMDEIFHVPQVQKYCQGNFKEWDPMITTLPGLYTITVGIFQPVSWLFDISMKTMCSIFWLRAINIGFALANVFVLRWLIKKIHADNKNYEEARGLVTSIALSLFPLLYFFTFLYYTDSGSTFFTLLAYLFSLYENHLLAALMGTIAVLFRQTNIIWVAFIAALVVIRSLLDFIRPDKKEIPDETVQSPEFLLILLQQLWKSMKSERSKIKRLVSTILFNTWPYVVVGVLFVAFVYVNGSIVVGAKDDHQASLHFPQVFYFFGFTAAFSWSHLASVPKLVQFVKFVLKRPIFVFLFCAIAFVVVNKFTYVHRYLLADNRHYTFYVWSKIFRRHEYVKFALIPGYLYAAWGILSAVQEKDFLWKILFLTCITVGLVPQMLMEFRYFIVPFLIFRLNMPLASYTKLALEILTYVVVNGVTLYMFMEKPFHWENATDQQRFMW